MTSLHWDLVTVEMHAMRPIYQMLLVQFRSWGLTFLPICTRTQSLVCHL